MTDDAQSLAERCGTSVHATEALLCNLQEQEIKQAMASSYIAPGALEGRSLQIYDLDQDDIIYIYIYIYIYIIGLSDISDLNDIMRE